MITSITTYKDMVYEWSKLDKVRALRGLDSVGLARLLHLEQKITAIEAARQEAALTPKEICNV
jgi:hypothetical protein